MMRATLIAAFAVVVIFFSFPADPTSVTGYLAVTTGAGSSACSASAPAQAQNAGFTTMSFCADFSQPSYAIQSNWLDCSDSNNSMLWHSGSPGIDHNGQVACDIHQALDASISQAVMHFQYLPSYGCQGCFNPMAMSTRNEDGGHINVGFINMYVEVTERLLATDSDAAANQLNGANGVYTWNQGTGGGTYEDDVVELYADRNGYSDAAFGNHGITGGFLFTSYAPGNTHVPSGYSVTAYHRYGSLITSDGSTATYVCSFIDDVFQSCGNLDISSGDSSMYHTPAWFVAGMENHNVLPSTQYDLYMQSIKVWTCTTATPCNGSTLFNSGGLTYWQPSSACQLGNHGLVRGRAHVLNGTIVAEDNCLLQMGYPQSGLPSQGLSLAQFQDVYNNGHYNTIRYSIYLGCWYDDTCGGAGGGQTITDIENQLDAAVSYANQIGLYILVDNHNTLPDPTGSGFGCPDWSADTTIWTAIAPRYANNTNVLYQIQNEPDWCGTVNYTTIAQNEDSLYKLIRSSAPNTPIFAWTFVNPSSALGGGLLSTLSQAPDISYSNASVDFHDYSSGDTTFINTARGANYPVTMSEYGICVGSAWDSVLNTMVSNGVSWSCGDGYPDGNPGFVVTWPKD